MVPPIRYPRLHPWIDHGAALGPWHGGIPKWIVQSGATSGLCRDGIMAHRSLLGNSVDTIDEALLSNFKTLVALVLEAEIRGTPRPELILEVGPTPQLLLDNGFELLPLIVKATTIGKICFDQGINTGIIERIPKLVATPSHLFRSASVASGVVLITIENKNGAPIIIALHRNKLVGRRRVNEVASVYAKEGPDPIRKWERDGLLLWKA